MIIFLEIIKLVIIITKELINYIFGKEYEEIIIDVLKKLSNYNIIFTKIFQWTSENKLLTHKIKTHMKEYTNNVSYNETDINYKCLLNTILYSNTQNDKLEIINITNPINSGSISLIFDGKLNDKKIIIKILRKDINNTVYKGLDLLVSIGQIMSFIPKIRSLMFDKLIEKNKQNILNQLDFKKEANNLDIFYNKFKLNKCINTPKVYSKYTDNNKNIIIMDYIDGKYISELTKEELNNYHYSFTKFIIKSIFKKQILHGDVHPGNIKFFEEIIDEKIVYKVGVIDMGMVFNLNIDDVKFLYLFFLGMFDNQFIKFIEYVNDDKNFGIVFENKNKENINKCINELKYKYEKKEIFASLNNIDEIVINIYLLLETVNDNNCEFKDNINKIILAIIPIIGIIEKLGPDINKNKYMREELLKFNQKKLFE